MREFKLSFDAFCYFMWATRWDRERLVGRTCEFIEAMGLPDKQEEAVKKHLKSIIWDCFTDQDSCLRGDCPEYKEYENGKRPWVDVSRGIGGGPTSSDSPVLLRDLDLETPGTLPPSSR